MDLANPLMDQYEKEYLEEEIEISPPTLNIEGFLLLYNEDGLNKMIKNPEFILNESFKFLNSFKK